MAESLAGEPTALPLQVVATAGHVDHGKSSLIVRLTGIDPDRWDEEKRRGLTIDLGFAWCSLPSGREIGFVDVPGHERFVRNMLAGVGPVRLVLFVVAADEGWKPQSEEHLAIVDVLGAAAGVVALTKADLVDEDTTARRAEDVRGRLRGTVLDGAPVVVCSSATGLGLDELRASLDEMLTEAPPPEDRDRPRIHIDRSFTIRGAGTVVTGTLTGGALMVGDEVRLYPSGPTARVRSLQTHKRPVRVARPVSRVAANLAGVPKHDAQRGDVLGRAGQWRPTSMIEGRVVPVRSLQHPLTPRGAYKLYIGTAERDARLRLYGVTALRPGSEAFARIALSRPVVAEVGDHFVLREAGRQETVAGGIVLDADPPARPGPEPVVRLGRRLGAPRERLAPLVVAERGAVRASELPVLAGIAPSELEGAVRVGPWWVAEERLVALNEAARDILSAYHRAHPLRPGMDAGELRRAIVERGGSLVSALEQGLAAALLGRLEEETELVREGTAVRLAVHSVSLGEREEEARRLVEAVASAEPTPPTVRELQEQGFPRELVQACVVTGRLARVSDDLMVTPGFLARAEEVVRTEGGGPAGITVSRFREALGTTRKYAVPLLEHFDRSGLTRRQGDVRRLIGSGSGDRTGG
ncbi:MAG TPA: selenocysteine-specific translation elongation factor [Actinomycetota bacterium]|jgi:selenocysteine-specific elongation factor|nr:selenocysteine-specific translation elongation factor [Actinomycetota bacterium]